MPVGEEIPMQVNDNDEDDDDAVDAVAVRTRVCNTLGM